VKQEFKSDIDHSINKALLHHKKGIHILKENINESNYRMNITRIKNPIKENFINFFKPNKPSD